MRKSLILGLIVLCMVSAAFAVPLKTNYQAKVTDTTGTPITGDRDITFRIFDAVTGGTEVWSETHLSISIVDGFFAVTLGGTNPLDIDYSDTYYLEVQIGSDVLSPREPFASVLYALWAQNADKIGGYDMTDWAWFADSLKNYFIDRGYDYPFDTLLSWIQVQDSMRSILWNGCPTEEYLYEWMLIFNEFCERGWDYTTIDEYLDYLDAAGELLDSLGSTYEISLDDIYGYLALWNVMFEAMDTFFTRTGWTPDSIFLYLDGALDTYDTLSAYWEASGWTMDTIFAYIEMFDSLRSLDIDSLINAYIEDFDIDSLIDAFLADFDMDSFAMEFIFGLDYDSLLIYFVDSLGYGDIYDSIVARWDASGWTEDSILHYLSMADSLLAIDVDSLLDWYIDSLLAEYGVDTLLALDFDSLINYYTDSLVDYYNIDSLLAIDFDSLIDYYITSFDVDSVIDNFLATFDYDSFITYWIDDLGYGDIYDSIVARWDASGWTEDSILHYLSMADSLLAIDVDSLLDWYIDSLLAEYGVDTLLALDFDSLINYYTDSLVDYYNIDSLLAIDFDSLITYYTDSLVDYYNIDSLLSIDFDSLITYYTDSLADEYNLDSILGINFDSLITYYTDSLADEYNLDSLLAMDWDSLIDYYIDSLIGEYPIEIISVDGGFAVTVGADTMLMAWYDEVDGAFYGIFDGDTVELDWAEIPGGYALIFEGDTITYFIYDEASASIALYAFGDTLAYLDVNASVDGVAIEFNSDTLFFLDFSNPATAVGAAGIGLALGIIDLVDTPDGYAMVYESDTIAWGSYNEAESQLLVYTATDTLFNADIEGYTGGVALLVDGDTLVKLDIDVSGDSISVLLNNSDLLTLLILNDSEGIGLWYDFGLASDTLFYVNYDAALEEILGFSDIDSFINYYIDSLVSEYDLDSLMALDFDSLITYYTDSLADEYNLDSILSINFDSLISYYTDSLADEYNLDSLLSFDFDSLIAYYTDSLSDEFNFDSLLSFNFDSMLTHFSDSIFGVFTDTLDAFSDSIMAEFMDSLDAYSDGLLDEILDSMDVYHDELVGEFTDSLDAYHLDTLKALWDNTDIGWAASGDSIGIVAEGPIAGYFDGDVYIDGSVSMPIRSITANYTAASGDYTILVDASSNNVTVTLPAAAGCAGRIYVIKAIDVSNTITIDGNGAETIDGAVTKTLATQYYSMTIQSNGSGWFIISEKKTP